MKQNFHLPNPLRLVVAFLFQLSGCFFVTVTFNCISQNASKLNVTALVQQTYLRTFNRLVDEEAGNTSAIF